MIVDDGICPNDAEPPQLCAAEYMDPVDLFETEFENEQKLSLLQRAVDKILKRGRSSKFNDFYPIGSHGNQGVFGSNRINQWQRLIRLESRR